MRQLKTKKGNEITLIEVIKNTSLNYFFNEIKLYEIIDVQTKKKRVVTKLGLTRILNSY